MTVTTAATHLNINHTDIGDFMGTFEVTDDPWPDAISYRTPKKAKLAGHADGLRQNISGTEREIKKWLPKCDTEAKWRNNIWWRLGNASEKLRRWVLVRGLIDLSKRCHVPSLLFNVHTETHLRTLVHTATLEHDQDKRMMKSAGLDHPRKYAEARRMLHDASLIVTIRILVPGVPSPSPQQSSTYPEVNAYRDGLAAWQGDAWTPESYPHTHLPF